MKKTAWRKFLVPLAILYVVIWVGVCGWVARQSRSDDWLVNKQASPSAGHLSDDDWCAILATETFASKSVNSRIALADHAFDDIKGLAASQGYDLKTLRSWFHQTATNFERYPVKDFVFGTGFGESRQKYRDLQDSGFPKPSGLRVFWQRLLSKQFLVFSLWLLPFIIVPLMGIVGVVAALWSKKLLLRWKTLIVTLAGIVVLEGFLIKLAGEQPPTLGGYSFYDYGDHLSLAGSWISDTEIDTRQTTKLDCWQQWSYCVEATAAIRTYLGDFLSLDTTYWPIREWRQDAILVEDNGSAACTSYSMYIDRENKTATMTRTTKKPKPDNCEGISDDPIFMHLAEQKVTHR